MEGEEPEVCSTDYAVRGVLKTIKLITLVMRRQRFETWRVRCAYESRLVVVM